MGYKIFHNITSSVLVNQTNYTTLVFENVTPGTYLFTVLAVNILGEGPEESIVITVSGYKYLFNGIPAHYCQISIKCSNNMY